MTTESRIEITEDWLCEEEVRSAFCESVEVPGDQYRQILDEFRRLRAIKNIALVDKGRPSTPVTPQQPDELWFIETVDQAIRRYHPQIAHKRAYSGDIARDLLSELRPYFTPTERETVDLEAAAAAIDTYMGMHRAADYNDGVEIARACAEAWGLKGSRG